MKNVKKTVLCLAVFVCMLALTACHVKTSLTYKFSVDNGDSILIKLDTTDKFKMTTDVPFSISQDGKEVGQGTFIHAEAFEQFKTAAETDPKATMLDSGEKDGNQYIYWNYDDKEFNYVVLVTDSNTGVIVSSNISQEAATECFNRMTISKK